MRFLQDEDSTLWWRFFNFHTQKKVEPLVYTKSYTHFPPHGEAGSGGQIEEKSLIHFLAAPGPAAAIHCVNRLRCARASVEPFFVLRGLRGSHEDLRVPKAPRRKDKLLEPAEPVESFGHQHPGKGKSKSACAGWEEADR